MKKLILALTCLFLAIPCQARIITIDNDGPADFNNIQAAINDSNDGDTIIVADGIYTGPENRDIDFGGKAITVRSENGPENCVIDCNGTVTDRHRGFVFWSGENADSAIIGFTITNGYAPLEWVSNPVPPWEDVASLGGAILLGSSPTISNCTIRGNQAIGHNIWYDGGGGIFNWGGSPTITNCTFSGNSTSNHGGGIACCGISNPTLTNCTFIGNAAADHGGGIACWPWWGSSNLRLANCTFAGNSAHSGGGMHNFYCNSTLTNCTFSGNVAQDTGGAIANDADNNLTLTNCTLSGNIAPNGNAISCDSYEQAYPSNLQLTNCILWDGGSEIWNNDNSPITITYSDVQDGWPGAGNLDIDPCFADPGYWDPNGTPQDVNDDFWVHGDYHLKSQAGRWDANEGRWTNDEVTSPCIDAGNPGCPLSNEPNDPNNVRINMGAYGGTAEASKSPANWRSIADMTNDWVVDSNDLKVFIDYWLQMGQCIPSDLDRSQSVDFNDFAIFGLQWSYPSASEPSMTFQIDDCNMDEGQSWPVAGESNEPRFSVWVEGRYIHFEDMMIANCCPDELGLEMTVEDSIITIYETEYTPGGCWCICDYPVTATLGPFEPGTYILEVYEEWSGYIGSTTVVIDPPE